MLLIFLISTFLKLSSSQLVDQTNHTSLNLTSSNLINLLPSVNASSSLDQVFINSSLNHASNHSITNSSSLNLTLNHFDSSHLICSQDQFFCSINSKLECLQNDFNCDGINHCDNGTDEIDCVSNKCGQEEFRCHGNLSFQCIHKNSYCDGLWDCDNGSDEDHCYFASCQQGLYRCTDQSRCLPFNQICDGKYDCRDHSDELDCNDNSQCQTSGKFFCDKGLCIEYSLKCDGSVDCMDGSDESNCSCSVNQFQCLNGDCIDQVLRCNKLNDCSDESDEWSCIKTDINDVVMRINPLTNEWAFFCPGLNFDKNDADQICNEMGYKSSSEFYLSLIKLESFNSHWVSIQDGNVTLSKNCDPPKVVQVKCQNFQCSDSSDGITRATSPSEINSLIMIKDEENEERCLGQMISSLWLLSSSVCLRKLIGKQLFVYGNESFVIGNASKIILHPHGSSFRSLLFYDYDIGLVKMTSPIDYEKKSPICLPARDVASEITCFMPLFNGTEPLPFIIREDAVCNEPKHFNNSLTSRQICADHTLNEQFLPLKGAHLICLSSSSEWFVAGFLSYFNTKFNYSHHPFVFSNAYSMMNFIESVTGLRLLRSDLEKTYQLITKFPSVVKSFNFQNASKTERTFETIDNTFWDNLTFSNFSEFVNTSDLDILFEENANHFNYGNDLDANTLNVSNISIYEDLNNYKFSSILDNFKNETSLTKLAEYNSTINSQFNESIFITINNESDLTLTIASHFLNQNDSLFFNQTSND